MHRSKPPFSQEQEQRLDTLKRKRTGADTGDDDAAPVAPQHVNLFFREEAEVGAPSPPRPAPWPLVPCRSTCAL